MNSTPILNEEQQQALNQMLSGRNIFLSGNAGSGKTTVIREFQRLSRKRLICLAPTGRAALNIGGMTIHRFFGFPATLLTRDNVGKDLSAHQLDLLQEAEVILIDEISMVRSDAFHFIEKLLRITAPDTSRSLLENPCCYRPFGGRQIIVVGDFYQLAPVVKEQAVRYYLEKTHDGIYAFKTSAWQLAKFEYIFLHQVHRQEELSFLEILNSLRTGDTAVNDSKSTPRQELEKRLADLNHTCACSPFRPDAVTLCTTRSQVAKINATALQELTGPKRDYKACVTGNFPSEDYPVEAMLTLTEGLRVMLQIGRAHV